MALPLIGAAIGLGSIVSGIFRGAKARRLEKQNPYPTATVDANIATNQALAQQRARVGLPSEQYNYGLQNIQRNQAGALSAAMTSGRPVNIASLLGQTNQATMQLDAQNAQARMNNQMVEMQANEALAAENQRVWQWNKANRYQQMAQRVAQLRSAAQQDIFGGIGALGQMAAGGVFGKVDSGSGGGGGLSSLFGNGGKAAANQVINSGALGNQAFGMAPVNGMMA